MSSSSEPSDDEADDPELALAIKLSLEMAAMDVGSRAREATAAGHVSPASEWASATLGAVPAASAPRPKGHLEDEEEGGGGGGGARADAVDYLSLLPEDLAPENILPLLDAPTCARCAAVSRRWRSQARLEPLWRAHCQALWAGKAVRLNYDSPWVTCAATVNGGPCEFSEAFPVLEGGASLDDGLALTWRESYIASLSSRKRLTLTDHDLVCNDWLITFSEPMLSFLPPEVLAIVHDESEELRAKFDGVGSGRRYTDGLFFRSTEPERTASWELVAFGTAVYIPQAGDGGVLEVSRDPATWQWSLQHEWLTMTSVAGKEVRQEGGGGGGEVVVLAPNGEPLRPRKELAQVRWRDSDSDSDEDED
jgi:hypothetical protein